MSSKSIAESTVNLAMSLETESNDVSIFNIVLRTDNPLLNQKVCEFALEKTLRGEKSAPERQRKLV